MGEDWVTPDSRFARVSRSAIEGPSSCWPDRGASDGGGGGGGTCLSAVTCFI